MDKYGVRQIKTMQQDALAEVRAKLSALRHLHDHEKTAEGGQQLTNLERQERELEEALAQPDPET